MAGMSGDGGGKQEVFDIELELELFKLRWP